LWADADRNKHPACQLPPEAALASEAARARVLLIFGHGRMLDPLPGSVFPWRMPRLALSLALWAALACWASGILWLSSMTPKELPEAAFLFSDKFNHFVAFAVGGWLAGSALRLSGPHSPVAGKIILAIVLVAAFGAFDEALQKFTPGRTGGDLYDWIADVLGAIAGALLTLPTHGRLERFLTRP
ncbi:MAG: VanZ family protein, partial [Chthoniobacterales bacterium]